MDEFKKILLPVDGSKSSRGATDNATNLSKLLGAEILLLYVTGGIPTFIKGKPREEADKAQKEEADQILAPYHSFLNENKVKYSAMVLPSFKVWKTICNVAQDEGCDIIVMGSRGLEDWEGAMLGSVTHRVLAHCTIPVLVVR